MHEEAERLVETVAYHLRMLPSANLRFTNLEDSKPTAGLKIARLFLEVPFDPSQPRQIAALKSFFERLPNLNGSVDSIPVPSESIIDAFKRTGSRTLSAIIHQPGPRFRASVLLGALREEMPVGKGNPLLVRFTFTAPDRAARDALKLALQKHL
ncbi:MAG TPA: hypothetical protein VJI13_05645 [Candidatus Norongarragalinales archaeon]|nr:hypothetical protein [Candidatus Norongarragalinales archaeon]